MSWLRRQRTLKSVVEDAGRIDLFGGKAEKNLARGSARSVGVGESSFMPHRSVVENEVGFRQR
jgi:hypothetical protein